MQKMFSKKWARPLLVAGEVCLLTAITLFAVFPISCKVTTSGIEIIGANYTVPSLDGYSVESEKVVTLNFSEEVNLVSAGVSSFQNENDASIPVNISYSDDKKTVTVTLLEETQIGQRYEFYGEVENKIGSSLMFAVPFIGYNSRVPDLILSEVHDGKATNKDFKGVKEYVEFLSLNDGNLSGLVVKLAGKGDSATFAFPPVEVQKGDFITLHYQPTENEEELCVSETSGDKTISSAKGSSTLAWDFWIETTETVISGSQDVITLENSYTGEILQAIAYAKTGKDDWTDKKVQSSAQKILENGLWSPTANLSDAFTNNSIVGIERTNIDEIISEYESGKLSYPFPSEKNEWKHASDGGLSPGEKNKLTPVKPKKK